MGKIIIQGGGVNLEEVTALPGDVVKGKTAYTQNSDDPTVGTLELTGDATDAYVYPGKTYYSTDPKTKRTGTMPTQAAKTITPGANAQTVAAGRYLTGAITVPGFALPAANTIKKGTTITIYGRSVKGTFEGYVPSVNDLYLRGNAVNLAIENTDDARFDSGQITLLQRGASFITKTAVNLSGKTKLSINGRFDDLYEWDSNKFHATFTIQYLDSPTSPKKTLAYLDTGYVITQGETRTFTISWPVQNISKYLRIVIGSWRGGPIWSISIS